MIVRGSFFGGYCCTWYSLSFPTNNPPNNTNQARAVRKQDTRQAFCMLAQKIGEAGSLLLVLS